MRIYLINFSAQDHLTGCVIFPGRLRCVLAGRERPVDWESDLHPDLSSISCTVDTLDQLNATSAGGLYLAMACQISITSSSSYHSLA